MGDLLFLFFPLTHLQSLVRSLTRDWLGGGNGSGIVLVLNYLLNSVVKF